MIKANELRVGNWVFRNTTKEYVQVSDIIIRKPNFEKEMDIINPIELTEDWLLRFGFDFKETEKARVYKMGKTFLFVFTFAGRFKDKSFLSVGNNQYPECWPTKYVHQLQNLYFALKGEELQIKTT